MDSNERRSLLHKIDELEYERGNMLHRITSKAKEREYIEEERKHLRDKLKDLDRKIDNINHEVEAFEEYYAKLIKEIEYLRCKTDEF